MESVIEFKLPALGENIDQGDLVRLMVAPGATISEGQAVMELETDKAVVEVPSSISGTIKQVLVKEGDKIKVGQVIFTADNNGASVADAKETPREKESAASKPWPAQRSSSATATAAKPQPAPAPPPAPSQRTRPTDAPPSTDFRLHELGANISAGDVAPCTLAPGATVSQARAV